MGRWDLSNRAVKPSASAVGRKGAFLQNQDKLQKLLVAMVAADTERKAQRYLLALNEKQ
ncbi:MAG: hypothetical protein ACRDHZ_20785 [Ktedonobacteraceae bacterium]